MRATIGLAACLCVLGLAGAATAATVPLKGTQTVVDESKGSYEVQGSLLGKWQATAFTQHYATPERFVASGRERFTGCLDLDRNRTCDAGEPSGSLRFTFIYWASFNPTTKALLRGACVHPVVGGTGDFAKSTGVVHMTDLPVGKTVRTTYTGELTVPGALTTSSVGGAERALQSRSVATCG
jgi:hypothetical protein